MWPEIERYMEGFNCSHSGCDFSSSARHDAHVRRSISQKFIHQFGTYVSPFFNVPLCLTAAMQLFGRKKRLRVETLCESDTVLENMAAN